MTAERFPADWSEIDAARREALAATMKLVVRHHPRYRRVMAEAGLAAGDVATADDLARLPPTTKAALMDDPDSFRLAIPEGESVPEEARTVWDVMYTTGSTSGRPTPFVNTTLDFWDILLLQRRMLAIRGVRLDDRIANLFPLTRHPHGAFIRVMHAAAAAHIPVVAALPGNPSPLFPDGLGQELDGVIDTLARTRPTILWGVPSYLRRVLARAAERRIALPEVRWLFVTGEGLSEEGRAELDARLAAIGAASARVSISYGMTEIQGGLVECTPATGYHNPLPEGFAIDIVDPETFAPLPDGTPGLVCLSHLRRRGTVLLRYLVGDTSVRTRERCPACGRVTERLIAQPVRADELVKIKGTLVNPARAVAAVEGSPAVRDFRFEVARSEAGPLAMDVLRLLVAFEPGAPADAAADLVRRVKEAIGVTPELASVPPDRLAAEQAGAWKAKRFIDRR